MENRSYLGPVVYLGLMLGPGLVNLFLGAFNVPLTSSREFFLLVVAFGCVGGVVYFTRADHSDPTARIVVSLGVATMVAVGSLALSYAILFAGCLCLP